MRRRRHAILLKVDFQIIQYLQKRKQFCRGVYHLNPFSFVDADNYIIVYINFNIIINILPKTYEHFECVRQIKFISKMITTTDLQVL